MNTSMRLAAATLLPLLPVTAQTTWSVPAFTALDATIAAAAPGDILLLGGNHPGFVLNKGLTLIGDTATISNSPGSAAGPTITIQVPPGQRAHLIGLFVWPTWNTPGGGVTASGNVSFEDCSITASGAGIAGVSLGQGTFSLQRCWASGNPGMRLTSGSVCSLFDSAAGGSPAAELQGGTLIGHGATFYGQGASLTQPAGHGLAATGADVWLTDSTVNGGGAFAGAVPGASAIAATSSSITFARTVVNDGGAATSSGFALAEERPAISISGPMLLGTSVDVGVTPGANNLILAIAASSDLVSTPAPLDGPLLLEPASLQPMLVAGGASPGAFPVSIPAAPALVGFAAWFQGAALTSSDILTTGVVGGVVR